MDSSQRAALKILFVGSFVGQDGKLSGGQMYACSTLVGAKFSFPVEWIKLDSTATTNKHRPFLHRLGLALSRLFKFMKILFSDRVDVVLVFTAHGFGFIEKGVMVWLARLFRRPVVLLPGSGLLIDEIESSRLMRWFVTRIVKVSSRVICQSPQWYNFYSELTGGNSNNLVVVKNWMELSVFEQIKRTPDVVEEGKVKVLFLGWVDRNKGIFDLLDAIHLLEDKTLELIVAGTGDADEELGKEINKLGLNEHVRRVGWVSGDLKYQLFSEADIFVLPSYREGLPNALLEAMASGLPCVASAVGGIPDVLENGISGFLIEPGDSQGIAEVLGMLATNSDKRYAVGMTARKKIFSEHSLKVAVNKFETIFEELR